MKKKSRLFFLALTAVYGIGFYAFYIKYVPLIGSFQAALAPILILAFALSALREDWGLLFFVFSYPLINNLPYFFGISEAIPHAPTALVLFLAFFFGWLVRRIFHKSDFSFRPNILKPIALFAMLIVTSAAITFFRYSNFFPFRGSRIYEIITNTIGVSAGGAIMSIIFFALNYLTGLAFFFVFISVPRSRLALNRIISVFCLSAFLALCFGLYQHLVDLKFGNNPRSLFEGLINGTFKDALSFGAFISMAAPLVVGAFFFFQWKGKTLALAICGLSSYLILFSGAKSGLLGFFFSLIVLIIFALIKAVRLIKARNVSIKKALSFAAPLVLIILALISALMASKLDTHKAVTYMRLNMFVKLGLSDYWHLARTSNWQVASYMIGDYPLTGLGIGSYIIEAPSYSREHKTEDIVSESAENYFLQVGSELGAIGLLLVFWISWEVAKQAWLIYKATPDSDRHKYILMGAIAGIVAYFVNIQAHTYIGSYEIKYTFWLLAGLIFSLGRTADSENKEKSPEEITRSKRNIFFSKSFQAFSLILIVPYAGIHLWNSTHSLSLRNRTEQLGIRQEFGFYQPEKANDGRPFRWSGKNGALSLKIAKPAIEVSMLASHPDILRDPVRVKVFIVKDFFKTKKLLGEIVLTRHIWRTYEFPTPEEVGQEVVLLIEVSRTWNPSKTRHSPDPRDLGVALGDIKFK